MSQVLTVTAPELTFGLNTFRHAVSVRSRNLKHMIGNTPLPFDICFERESEWSTPKPST